MDNSEYISCKTKLDRTREEKANCSIIRGKRDWYKYEEKSTKFFPNLEKIPGYQNKIRNILKNGKEISDQKEVNNELFDYCSNLFKIMAEVLSSIQISPLTEEQSVKCQISIS